MFLSSIFRVARPKVARRLYRVLAIESSCDDSCVALLDRSHGNTPPRIIDEVKVTLNSAHVGGIIPTVAHEFHQANIANIVQNFCLKHDLAGSNVPDLICVTRGPGMVGSLSASIQFAKGLAVAWNKPLVGVHHMLGHLLTAMLPSGQENSHESPKYPFLSLLCSGGHTMLVLLKSLTDHQVIINTSDIAAGDSLDKCARELGLVGNMLGPELEKYVTSIDPPLKREFEKTSTYTDNKFDFRLRMPMRGPKHKKVPDTIEFGFASFLSSITGYKSAKFGSGPMDETTKQFVAFKLQEVLFDHIVNRINVAFAKHGNNGDGMFGNVQDFVCSGGVAANSRLREKLFEEIKSEYPLKFHFPDLKLCTDNATMIGNAGIHIFEQLRIKSDLNILPIRKWPMNELLAADGWKPVSDEEYALVTECK